MDLNSSKLFQRDCSQEEGTIEETNSTDNWIASIMMLLAGCTQVNQPITAESVGFWNTYIVYPLSQLIIWFQNY